MLLGNVDTVVKEKAIAVSTFHSNITWISEWERG